MEEWVDTARIAWPEVTGLCGFWDGSCDNGNCGRGIVIMAYSDLHGWLTFYKKCGPVPGNNSVDAAGLARARRSGREPPSSGTLSSSRKKCCVPGSWGVGASGTRPCTSSRTHSQALAILCPLEEWCVNSARAMAIDCRSCLKAARRRCAAPVGQKTGKGGGRSIKA